MLDVAEPIMRLMNAKRVKNPVFIVIRIIMQDPRFVKKGKIRRNSLHSKKGTGITWSGDSYI